jgi:hypothetical protein
MQRIVLDGQRNFSEEDTFSYVEECRHQAVRQWAAPATHPLKVFFMFYVNPGAEKNSIPHLLRPILKALRGTVYRHESQIFPDQCGQDSSPADGRMQGGGAHRTL